MGAQWNQRGKPQYAGSYLCPDCCVGRRSARLSLLPFCQTASAFRLICLFHTFCRRGVYRATVFAPLRCPKFFRFPFACFAHLFFQYTMTWPKKKDIFVKCVLFMAFRGHILRSYSITILRFKSGVAAQDLTRSKQRIHRARMVAARKGACSVHDWSRP